MRLTLSRLLLIAWALTGVVTATVFAIPWFALPHLGIAPRALAGLSAIAAVAVFLPLLCNSFTAR